MEINESKNRTSTASHTLLFTIFAIYFRFSLLLIDLSIIADSLALRGLIKYFLERSFMSLMVGALSIMSAIVSDPRFDFPFSSGPLLYVKVIIFKNMIISYLTVVVH